MTKPRGDLLISAIVLLLAGCSSNSESVCENVAACARGGDSEWIASCEDDAAQLDHLARAHACGPQFDDYYACAAANFSCKGATPSFNGCDAKRAVLENCLATSQAETPCDELASKTAVCRSKLEGTLSSDVAGVSSASSVVPPACTIERECQARCFLDNVSNPCTPGVDELPSFTACAESCPP